MSIKTNPYKAVAFNEKAITKVFETAGSVIADVKYDGVRGNIVVNPIIGTSGQCTHVDTQWLSRVSKPIPALEYLNGVDETRWADFMNDLSCIYPHGMMIDGELMVKGVDFNTGSGLLRTKWSKKNNVVFNSDEAFLSAIDQFGNIRKKAPFCLDTKRLKVAIYAVLPLDVIQYGEDVPVLNCIMQQHVAVTVELLNKHFPEIEWVVAESYDVYDMVELNQLYEKKRAEGHEGLIVKDPLGHYRRGKKSGWWKMKPENEADGVIQGLIWGTEGKANEGKVIGFEVLLESGRVVNATNISQSMMDEFTTAVQESFATDETINPYEGWACQISYMEETPDGSLRHPSFICFRGTEENPSEKI